MLFEDSVINPTSKIGSSDIVAPVLLVLAFAERAGLKSLPTSQIREVVSKMVVLSPEDKEPYKGRTDRGFDQIVRNLVSHKTLLNRGFVRYEKPRANQATPPRMSLTKKGRAYLTSKCLPLIELPSIKDELVSVDVNRTSRVSEAELLPSALLLLAKLNANADGAPISTTALRQALKAQIAVAPEDAQRLKGRNDTRIDQKIRNMISHGTLLRMTDDLMKKFGGLEDEGLVEHSKEGLKITETGMSVLLEEFLDVLPAPDFSTMTQPTTRASRPARMSV